MANGRTDGWSREGGKKSFPVNDFGATVRLRLPIHHHLFSSILRSVISLAPVWILSEILPPPPPPTPPFTNYQIDRDSLRVKERVERNDELIRP